MYQELGPVSFSLGEQDLSVQTEAERIYSLFLVDRSKTVSRVDRETEMETQHVAKNLEETEL